VGACTQEVQEKEGFKEQRMYYWICLKFKGRSSNWSWEANYNHYWRKREVFL